MNRLKFINLFVLLIFLQISYSETHHVVFQNGLNGYSGCHDSFIEDQQPAAAGADGVSLKSEEGYG